MRYSGFGPNLRGPALASATLLNLELLQHVLEVVVVGEDDEVVS